MKNSTSGLTSRFMLTVVAGLSISLALACQGAKLAEYKKLQNDGEVPRISVEDAKKAVDAGLAVIVDSRAEAAYRQERIAGSISMPIGAPAERFSELPQGKQIIIYCS